MCRTRLPTYSLFSLIFLTPKPRHCCPWRGADKSVHHAVTIGMNDRTQQRSHRATPCSHVFTRSRHPRNVLAEWWTHNVAQSLAEYPLNASASRAR